MDLEVPRLDRRQHGEPAQLAAVAADEHRVALGNPEPFGVGGTYEHGLARRAGERVATLLDHAVELFAAPRRAEQPPVGRARGCGSDGRELRLPVRGREFIPVAQEPPSVLERVASARECSDALVARDHTRDLLP